MLNINARNPNQALPQALHLLYEAGIREKTRTGPVLRAPGPVATVLQRPCERVVTHAWRDANPFFHIVEALWMLAGRDDLKQLTPYVPNMGKFSDDGGKTQPGAYGKRWRGHRDPWQKIDGGGWRDQLNWAVRRLRKDPGDRRVVIQMWDPDTDIQAVEDGGKDVPCNLTMLPWVLDGALHLTIFNRSNDIIWGLYGANAVHFSVALEYLAGRIGLQVGTMTTVSNNFHGYLATMPEKDCARSPVGVQMAANYLDPYDAQKIKPYSLFTEFPAAGPYSESELDHRRERVFQEDLLIFFEHGWREAATKARWPFLRRVAVPLAAAHEHWRITKGEDRYLGALGILEQCQASDWRLAAQEWIQRRYDKWQNAADDGVQK